MKKSFLKKIAISTIALSLGTAAMASPIAYKIKTEKLEQKQHVEQVVQHLSAKKRAAYTKIVKSSHKRAMQIRTQLKAKRAMLKAQLLQPKLNLKKIKSLTHHINRLRSRLLTSHINAVVKIKRATGKHLPDRLFTVNAKQFK